MLVRLQRLVLVFALILVGCTAAMAQAPKKRVIKTRILFVLDASGSMVAKLDKGTRWEVARDLLSALVDSIESHPNLEMALRVYGHQFDNRQNNCQDTKLEVGFARDNAPNIQKKLKQLVPKGNTPISYSLMQAANDFPPDPFSRNVVILITDGLESCNQDPCEVSLALQRKRVFMRPYIVGIGTDEEFGKQLNCIGQYLNASSASSLKNALNQMVRQALRRTTVSVLITDHTGKPYENNLNMTFINTVTNQPQYNFIHYFDKAGRTDTVNVDPVLGYDLVVNTIPPVTKKDIKIEAGRHNEIKVQAPQGILQFRQDGIGSSSPIMAVVSQAGKDQTINHQPINSSENYLAGRYDIEVLTLPRLYFKNVSIKPNETTTLNVPIAGVMNISTAQEGYGSIYELTDDGAQQWIYNFPGTNSRINVSLQPGKYRVAFRTKSSKGSEFTDTQDFTIRPGATTTVRLFTR